MRASRTVVTALTAGLVATALAGCGVALPGLPTAPAAGRTTAPTAQAAASPVAATPTATAAPGAAAGAGAVTPGAGTATVDCSAFTTAVQAIVPGGISAPSESEGTCTWGIGSNASAQPSDLGQSLQDVFALHFTDGDDAETQYGGNVQFMGGADHATAIPGIGSAAVYIAGENGVPNVAAWSGQVSCGSTLFVSDAATLGLTSPGGGRIIAQADVAGLAKRIADACAVGWSG